MSGEEAERYNLMLDLMDETWRLAEQLRADVPPDDGLAIEYSRLFDPIGPSGPACPLNSGALVGDDGRMKLLEELVRFYNHFGLTAAGAPGEQTRVPGSPVPTSPAPTPEPYTEERLIELEWPESMRIGESDVLRLALVPSKEGYTAEAEFGEHSLDVQAIPLQQTPGYTLYGIARLDGVAFQISPSGDQRRVIPPGEQAAWRWTLAARQAGRQRLSISLTLRWEPQEGIIGPVSESLAFGRGLNVQVRSLFGLSQPQALLAGMAYELVSALPSGVALLAYLACSGSLCHSPSAASPGVMRRSLIEALCIQARAIWAMAFEREISKKWRAGSG